MNVLQFSGGVDSLACLLLLEDEPGLVVVSVLTDGAYESTHTYLQMVEKEFPKLKFVRVPIERNLAGYGRPVDVVPLHYTAMGQLTTAGKDVRYQDYFSCCHRSIWQPLDEVSRTFKPEVIYRGQRNDDRQRAPVWDGFVDRGVTIRFPIHAWTKGEAVSFVESRAPHLMPPGYAKGEKTSRDCWDCTAYLVDNKQRIDNLPDHKKHVVQRFLARWRDDVFTELGDCDV